MQAAAATNGVRPAIAACQSGSKTRSGSTPSVESDSVQTGQWAWVGAPPTVRRIGMVLRRAEEEIRIRGGIVGRRRDRDAVGQERLQHERVGRDQTDRTAPAALMHAPEHRPVTRYSYSYSLRR